MACSVQVDQGRVLRGAGPHLASYSGLLVLVVAALARIARYNVM